MANNPIVPFDYLEREKRRNQRREPASDDPVARAMELMRYSRPARDPVSETIAAMHLQEVRQTIHQAPDAETTAKVSRVSREVGEPPALIEDRIRDIERAQRADRMTKVLGRYPVFTSWAQSSPRGVVAASDDHKALGILGTAWETLRRTSDPVMAFARAVDEFDRTDRGTQTNSVIAPVYAVVASMMGDQSARDALPSPKVAGKAVVSGTVRLGRMATAPAAWATDVVGWSGAYKAARAADTAIDQYSKGWMPRGKDWVSDQVLGGVANAPNTIASLGLGLGGRALGMSERAASILAITPMSVQQGGESYLTARDQGVDKGTASIYGIITAAAEAGGEYLGTKAFLRSSGAGDSILKRYIRSQIPDLVGEEATTVAEKTADWIFLPENRNKTLGELAAEMPGELAGTAIQTLVGGGLTNATVSGLEMALGTTNERLRRQVAGRIAGPVREAYAAELQAEFFNQVERAAVESKMRKIDPDGYAELVAMSAASSGIESAFISVAHSPDYISASESYL